MMVPKKKVFRYSINLNSIFRFLKYQVNKLHPVKKKIIVSIKFVF